MRSTVLCIRLPSVDGPADADTSEDAINVFVRDVPMHVRHGIKLVLLTVTATYHIHYAVDSAMHTSYISCNICVCICDDIHHALPQTTHIE